MRKHRIVTGIATLALTTAGLLAPAVPAQAAAAPAPGNTSIMSMLSQDGRHLDRSWKDFDLFEKFVRQVYGGRPHSSLRMLANGNEPLTVLMPTDYAFRHAAHAIAGGRYTTEHQVYRALKATPKVVEDHLLMGVVPGRTMTHHRMVSLAPTRVSTAEGGMLRIRYRHGRLLAVDAYPGSPNAWAPWPIANLDAGNLQIAHGITQMLSPLGQ